MFYPQITLNHKFPTGFLDLIIPTEIAWCPQKYRAEKCGNRQEMMVKMITLFFWLVVELPTRDKIYESQSVGMMLLFPDGKMFKMLQTTNQFCIPLFIG